MTNSNPRAPFVAVLCVFCAVAAVLLWDGTNRFNKVHWQCHYHAHGDTNTTVSDVAQFSTNITTQYLRHMDDDYYDNNHHSNPCNSLYSEAVAEYVFGCFIGYGAVGNLLGVWLCWV